MMPMLMLIIFCWAWLVLTIVADLIYGSQAKSSYFKKFIGKERKNAKSKNKVRSYKVNRKDYIKYSLPISAGLFIALLIFLGNPIAAFFISLVGFFFPRYRMIKEANKRKELLNTQFKELLLSIANSLKVGSSLQMAIERSLIDLRQIYKNHIDKPIVDELEFMVYEIRIGKNLEEVLLAFKNRVDLEDVTSFTNAAIMTEQTGGNLTEVMSNVAEVIGEKIQMKREIMTLTAAKRSEAKILTVMPMLLVVTLTFLAPQYMEPMYESMLGRVLMVTGLLLIVANYFIGKRIINIDV